MPDDDPSATFTHLDSSGRVRMVDVGAKPVTHRTAVAEGFVVMGASTLERLLGTGEALPKASPAEALAAARLAGIMAAKKTGDLVPMCHPLPLDAVNVDLRAVDPRRLQVVATVTCTGRTGVEMEALVAVSAAALCVYDLCKAVDKGIVIDGVRLLRKTGGRGGDYDVEDPTRSGASR